MTRIPPGRIIRVDMGGDRWGRVLYMVANPPIVCETCGTVVFEWRTGEVLCPDCGNVITSRVHCPCPRCGEDDWHTLRVVTNDNFHYDSLNDEVVEFNDKAGRVLNVCGRSLMDDVAAQRASLLTARDSQDCKRRILWTMSDDYDPDAPMPQWVKDRFPYDGQD